MEVILLLKSRSLSYKTDFLILVIWIDFVAENRNGMYKGEAYDIIYGPVANDDVYTTFTLYQAGVLTKEQTIETLKIKKLYDQMVFTTEKALSFLKFVGTIDEEEM